MPVSSRLQKIINTMHEHGYYLAEGRMRVFYHKEGREVKGHLVTKKDFYALIENHLIVRISNRSGILSGGERLHKAAERTILKTNDSATFKLAGEEAWSRYLYDFSCGHSQKEIDAEIENNRDLWIGQWMFRLMASAADTDHK